MSYAHYVTAAYAIFALVLGWDFFSTRIRIARELRAARRRRSRDTARARPNPSVEVQ